jgi:small subunit ribosomal protein S5
MLLQKLPKKPIKVNIDENGSIAFPSYTKFGAVELFLKPATPGTGLIAGGFLRPVLELAGITNVYSKITRSRNKVAGVEAVFKALAQYSK